MEEVGHGRRPVFERCLLPWLLSLLPGHRQHLSSSAPPRSSTSEQDEGSAQNGGGGLGAESVALTEAWALSGAWGGPRERHGLHL